MVLPKTAFLGFVALISLSFMGLAPATAQPHQHRHGRGGKGMHRGMDDDARKDMELFHYLLDQGDKIRRTVEELPDGVETLTESDDTQVAEKIREHVRSMYARLEEGRPIHRRDPLFDEIFRHADEIEMTMEPTEKGIRVRETSTDPYVVKLIQSHAEVVSAFIANGMSEMRKDHPVPPRQ
jgi:hypothetical protein